MKSKTANSDITLNYTYCINKSTVSVEIFWEIDYFESLFGYLNRFNINQHIVTT